MCIRDRCCPSTSKGAKHPLFDDSRVHGRDEERDAILQTLLFEEPQWNKIGLIAIVGMVGILKNLAKLVFSNIIEGNLWSKSEGLCLKPRVVRS